jgi:hypothetical protein
VALATVKMLNRFFTYNKILIDMIRSGYYVTVFHLTSLNSTKYESIWSGKLDPVLEGVELLFHQKGESASFGAKMLLSLNGVDLGCMNSINGSTCRAKGSNILHDTQSIHYAVM